MRNSIKRVSRKSGQSPISKVSKRKVLYERSFVRCLGKDRYQLEPISRRVVSPKDPWYVALDKHDAELDEI